MSQHLIAADFKNKEIVYVTDQHSYAKMQQDEHQVMTGDKYEVVRKEMYIVRRVLK